ncbi:immunoglobulin-like domain-containing protein [Halomonas sp. PA16-9]|uniref:immunoglobulin-like domain-containing protein n=1 Tax=Halomonas sp. PA16-9 TaxID=2576841 RepID=UPI0030EC9537
MADQAEFSEAEEQTFTVSLSEAVDREVTVTLDGGNTVTIAAGETDATYTRDPQGDDVFVDGENVTVALEDAAATDGSAFENVTWATPPRPRSSTLSTPSPPLSADSDSVAEGGTVTYTVTLTGPQGADLSGHNGLEFRLADGSTVHHRRRRTQRQRHRDRRRRRLRRRPSPLVNSIATVENDSDSEFEQLVTAGETSVTVTDEPGTPGNPGDPGDPNGGDAISVSIVADQAEFSEAEEQTFTVSLSEAVDRDVTVTLDGGNTVTIAAARPTPPTPVTRKATTSSWTARTSPWPLKTPRPPTAARSRTSPWATPPRPRSSTLSTPSPPP